MMPPSLGSNGVDQRKGNIMADRRRAGVWAAGIVALAGLGGVLAWSCWPTGGGPAPVAKGPAAKGAQADLGALAAGSSRALDALQAEALKADEGPIPGYSKAGGAAAVATIVALDAGFDRFGNDGRSAALKVCGRLVERFGADPAPACWANALKPSHAILIRGLADPEAGVRSSALGEVGRLWSWAPGLTPTPAEEEALEVWKASLLTPTVRRLTDRDPAARGAAVACLAKLPINDAAAPAVTCLADPDATVRQQVLIHFANRASLLNEEAILPRLYDPSKLVVLLAERVLKARGLTDEQIGLGRLVYHPDAETRASAIPKLLPRTDIDPVVWLLLLSHDREESVRARAVEALAGREAPEVGRRLREMAQTDESAKIRAAAAKVAPASEATAALPPLPGSASLNPRAN